MAPSARNPLAALLLSGVLLTGCNSNPPATQDAAVNREGVVSTGSAAPKTAAANTMGVSVGSIPAVGNPQITFTLLDSYNTPPL